MAMSGSLSHNFYGGYHLIMDWTAKHNVMANKSTVTVTLKLKADPGWSLYVSSQPNTYVEIDGTRKTFTAPAVSTSGGTTHTLGTVSHTVNHDSGGYKTLTLKAYYFFNATIGGTYVEKAEFSRVITLDKITQPPNLPTNVTASRISDTSCKVEWAHVATTLRPVNKFYVQRWDIATGAWTTRGTVGGTIKTYTDTTAANRMYRYRVKAENSYGGTDYVNSNYVKTTPAAPSNVSLAQNGNNMVLNWKNNHPVRSGYTYVTGIRIQVNKDGGGYSTLTTVGPNDTTYTHINPGGGYYRYRIRAEADSLASDYATTAEVRLAFAPDPPTGAAVSRISDDRLIVSWTNNPTTEKPYDYINIQRWDNVTGSYYDLQKIAGTATSYTDTTTQGNRQYRYRVRAENSAGNSSYTETGYQNTTPAKPTGATATRVDTNVKVTWGNPATNATVIRLQRCEKINGEWGEWGDDVTLAGNAVEYLDVTPLLIGKYRVRAEAPGSTLVSDWTETNEVITIQPPAPPSHLNPDNTPFDAGQEKKFTWQHNTIDGTGQTKYSIRYREQGASWPATPQVNEQAGTVSEHTFAADTFINGKTYEWQVKTWGVDPDPSGWSNTAVFIASSAPTVIITQPVTGEYPWPELTVKWLYSDPEGHSQVQQVVTLYDSRGSELERQSKVTTVESGGTGEATLQRVLVDGEAYRVTVTVRDSSGMWSEVAEVTFDVAYFLPPKPEVELNLVREEGKINISIINPDPEEGEVAAVYNDVYRSIDGEEFKLFMTGVPVNTTITDNTPTVGGNNAYYVIAYSDLPSAIQSDTVSMDVHLPGHYFLSGGPGWGNVIRFLGDVSITENLGRDTVLRTFAGRKYPVKFQGEALTQELSFSAETTEREKVKAIAEYAGSVYYRDYQGRRFTCAIMNPKLAKKDRGLAYQFSCNIVRTEGEEQ